MGEPRPELTLPATTGDRESVDVTGLAVVSAFGRGTQPLLDGLHAGTPAFGPVRRFDVSRRRVTVAATFDDRADAGTGTGTGGPAEPSLLDELVGVVDGACLQAGLADPERRDCGLLLAVHGDPAMPRAAAADRPGLTAAALADVVAGKCGLAGAVRTYTSACVAASTAVADAAYLISTGRLSRVVVAAGYLVESDQFALFDAGRALATDGQVRPFSSGRTGLLLGDGVAAVVLESGTTARRRGANRQARIAGWGRSGDGYHPCQPRPDGAGLARAITAALGRAGVTPEQVGYINAHGSGTAQSDVAETAALYRAFGPLADRIPISSTKALHGQVLEASGLLELAVTVLAVQAGQLPVNAGFLDVDPDCRLDLVLDGPRPAAPAYALTLNAAFGGANTALLVGAA